MKSFSVLALAATASATSWNDAPGFSCPGNTDNTCNTQQSGDDFSSWGDLSVGSEVSYFGGMYFGNTKCESAGSFGKRALENSRFSPRTGSKAIGGSCGHDSSASVNMGCGSKGSSSSYSGSSSEEISAFSIDYFSIYTEFDCDLEFQYTMGDGSSCKHRSSCSSQGSTVKNSQCGGATNLTIVYPTGQTHTNIPPKSTTCSVNIPTVSFSCGSASSTVMSTTQSNGHSQTSVVVPTPTGPSGGNTQTGPTGPTGFSSVYSSGTTMTSNIQSATTSSTAGVQTTAASSSVETSSVASSSASSSVETSSIASSSATSSSEVASSTVASSTEVVSSTASSVVVPGSSTQSSVVESATSSNSPVTQTGPPAVASSDYSTSTYVTSYIGTSTVYSTSYATITSCAPEITNCPIKSGETATTTVVVAISTTICPVTETQTAVYSSGATTPIASGVVSTATPGASGVASSVTPEQSVSSNSPVQATGSGGPGASGATTVLSSAASTTTQTIGYPTVLPACISTWNYITGCVDNSDTSCYCPDATFVQNVYDCLYAYGESDQDVADAVAYFQGLCGSYAQGNPGIATGATITSYITATPTPIESVSATTIVVTATAVVPCTDSNGAVIPSSSSTIVTSVSMTVPQVALTTDTAGGTTSVGVIPVTSLAPASSAVSSNAAQGAPAPYATGSAAGSQPSGVAGASGGAASKTTSAGGAIVTAGATKAHVGAGFGAAALAAFALAL